MAHRRADLKTHLGCSGWFYWHWRETFYPPGVPTHKWFAHYAKRFKTVELNAPFYRWPTRSTVRSWIRQAPKRGFVYSIKVNGLITHEKRFKGTKRLVRKFYDTVAELGPKLGCLLFQMPPSFRYSKPRLMNILRQLDPRFKNVLEFRHKSWWNADVYRALRRRNVIFCSMSGPRLPDKLVKTTDDIYIRFHGLKKWYRHDYSATELLRWAQTVTASGARDAWIYFNNDRNLYSIKNARILLRLIKQIRRPSK
jgi:uncharacterized protein YecE (DUF72 family)